MNQNAVQELQVISGAFNAEYGQAQSGVVNLVTKDGNNDFNFTFQTFTGDYVSSRNSIYENISDINPVAIRNFEGSVSGPVIRDDMFFFVNGRYYYNTGSLFGRRIYKITDRAVESGDSLRISQSGDRAAVPMNDNENIYAQGKLSYQLFQGFKVSYNYILERRNYHDYDHYNKLTPDNNLNRFDKSYTNILSFNHAISSNSYYTLNLSYAFKDYHHYLFENIYTGDTSKPTNYVDNTILITPPYSFGIGGTNNNRFTRNTGTYGIKLDWVTQINQEINIQFGGNFAKHRMYLKNINLVPMVDANGQKVDPYNVSIPKSTTTDYDTYLHKPFEASGYVQTKFEAFNLIFNLGLRFDYFEPDGVVLVDPTDPSIFNPLKPDNRFNDLNGNGVQDQGEASKSVADRRKYWYKDATAKTQLSPRVGLAFPIDVP